MSLLLDEQQDITDFFKFCYKYIWFIISFAALGVLIAIYQLSLIPSKRLTIQLIPFCQRDVQAIYTFSPPFIERMSLKDIYLRYFFNADSITARESFLSEHKNEVSGLQARKINSGILISAVGDDVPTIERNLNAFADKAAILTLSSINNDNQKAFSNIQKIMNSKIEFFDNKINALNQNEHVSPAEISKLEAEKNQMIEKIKSYHYKAVMPEEVTFFHKSNDVIVNEVRTWRLILSKLSAYLLLGVFSSISILIFAYLYKASASEGS